MTEARLAATAFWYLRHGQTDWNRDNLAQGLTDVPLNQQGIDQAQAAADRLAGHGIAAVVCSPLIRAHRTAEIVAARIGVGLRVEPELHEASFGCMERLPMLAPWFLDWIDRGITPQGAEPFAAVRQRVTLAVNRALAANPAPLLVVAHGAVFRGLRAAMGLRPDERLMNAVPMLCRPPVDAGEPWSLQPLD